MKTIRNLLSFLFLLLTIAIVGNIVISTIGLFLNQDILSLGYYSSDEASLSIQVIFILKAVALLLFVYATFILIRKLHILTNGDFFSPELINCFRKTGFIFCLSGTLGFVVSIASMYVLVVLKDYSNQFYLNFDSKSLYIMLMILGCFFLLFAKVLNKGGQIQQENNLTI